jgi:hypothetical protein
MELMSYTPPIGAETLQRIDLACRLATENPNFLADADYPPPVKDWLRRLVALRHPTAGVALDAAADVELASTEVEITELLKHLKSLKNSIGTDANDQLAWVKAGTTLLDKLLTMQERAANVKTVKVFEDTVIGIMEDFLTPEQRTAFRQRLDEAQS